MTFLSRAVLLLLCLLLLLITAAWFTLRSSLPVKEGAVTLPGINGTVELRYDEWQRPFVRAGSLEDALSVQGWLHASHRLWQMELLRRAGTGRLAELLGKDLLATDIELWRIGVPRLAEALARNADERTLKRIDRYVAGINAAVEQLRVLPPEFLLLQAPRPAWRREDVFALGALMAHQSANNMENEVLRLALAGVLDADHFDAFAREWPDGIDYPYVLPNDASIAGLIATADRLALTDPAHNRQMPPLGFGSNGWVVAGDRSASSVPLNAFDSHDELGLPNLFYEVHLFFGAGRQLRGWSVPGLPGVINGFNEAIAWGFTNIGDTRDVFIEERDANDPARFRDGEDWYRARTEEVTIPVAGEAAHTLTLTYTRNGPLISEDPPLSLAWAVQYMDTPRLDAFWDLNLALDWASYSRALEALPVPTLNATFADIHGTIAFQTAGALPLRGAGEGRHALSGADPVNRWRGLVPAVEMPRLVNPQSGYVAAANARVNAPADGPLVSADNAAPYRIATIQRVLSAGDAFSVDDMRRLQMNRDDGQARLLLPSMLETIDEAPLTTLSSNVLSLLGQWSREPVASSDSAAALVFQLWYLALAEEVFAERTGELWPRLQRRGYLLNQALDQLLLETGESPWWRGDRGFLLARSLNATTESLALELGDAPERWRLDHKLSVGLSHALGDAVPGLDRLFNLRAQPWGGGASTVGRANYSYARPMAVVHGATVRMVAEMTRPPTLYAVIPGGQSGHPLSGHYGDQFDAWLAGELLPIAATPEAVKGRTLTFSADD